MTFIPLPAFQDNSLWLLHDGHRALVVDRGGAQPVFAALQQHDLQLEAILVTHHQRFRRTPECAVRTNTH